ncbi:MAG: EamA family transporter [Candidatus Omnitrophica bacterium]|nr:EamA family transporter [Candidatus Omnitrophota bacterium]
MNLAAFIFLFLHEICSTAEQVAFKKAADRLEDHHLSNLRDILSFAWQTLKIPLVWLGFVLVAGGWVFWFALLTYVDLNVAILVDSLQYILIFAVSYFILKERIHWTRALGSAFVMLGVFLVLKG